MGANGVNLDGIKQVDTSSVRTRPWASAVQGPLRMEARHEERGDRRLDPGRRQPDVATEPALHDQRRRAAVLGGVDAPPNPVEVLLAALAGCVTAGIATNADMFGVPIDAHEHRAGGGRRRPRHARPRQDRAQRRDRHPLHGHHPEPGLRGTGAPLQGDDRPQVSGTRHAGQPRQHHVEVRLQAELRTAAEQATKQTGSFTYNRGCLPRQGGSHGRGETPRVHGQGGDRHGRGVDDGDAC